MSTEHPLVAVSAEIEKIKRDLNATIESKKARVGKKVAGAALSNIPWVGTFLQAAIDYRDEQGQSRVNELLRSWLEEHNKKFHELGIAIDEVLSKVGAFDEEITERLESEEFLGIVRKAFKSWDQADTWEKREMLRFLLANAAAGAKLCEDDIIKLFIDWIDKYHETHFRVLRIIYRNSYSTRASIWQELGGVEVRDDSAEAGLFRMLIDDLSQGRLILQRRDVTSDGQYLAKARPTRRKPSGGPRTLKSSFDDHDEYELSSLGTRFVHYAMKDVAPMIGGEPATQTAASNQ